ncbi:MAG: hypothetical protein R3257_07740, partial [bacterium]|nr:hypothetical protein [bacterium]
MEIQNKKIAVLGLGKDGLSLAFALAKKGAQVEAFGTPGNEYQKIQAEKTLGSFPVKLHWEEIPEDALTGFDLIVFSTQSGHFHRARDFANGQGVPVFSDLDLVSQFLQGSIIAVTGTNG